MYTLRRQKPLLWHIDHEELQLTLVVQTEPMTADKNIKINCQFLLEFKKERNPAVLQHARALCESVREVFKNAWQALHQKARLTGSYDIVKKYILPDADLPTIYITWEKTGPICRTLLYQEINHQLDLHLKRFSHP